MSVSLGTNLSDTKPSTVQRTHYDRAAAGVSTDTAAWHIGAEALWPEFRAPYEYVFNNVLTDLRDLRVLDYGCGYGHHTAYLAARGAQVVALDISQGAIDIAAARVKHHALSSRVRFEVGDCEATAFPTGEFDVVFSSGTLSCLRLDAVYGEMHRLLRPGGRAVIVDTLGHNALLNLNRRLKLWRGLKTRWSVDHILTMTDLSRAHDYFLGVELAFFDFLTVPLALLRNAGHPTSPRILDLARAADRGLLRLPVLRRQAFKVVVVLSR